MSRLGPVVAIAGLVVSAVLACVLCAAWLMVRVGPVPLPVAVLAGGAWMILIVRLAGRWSARTWVRALPVIAWVLTLVVLDAGPGGDMPVQVSLRGLALLLAGAVLPLWWAALRPTQSGQ